MQGLTLKQLRYFQALARYRHFGKAAEACKVSQPALSVQLQELETQLGAPLVVRQRGRAQLTAVGQQVLPKVQELLVAAEALHEVARSSGAALAGRLRLGVIPTAAPYLLPSLLQQVRRVAPEIQLRAREAVTSKLLQELRTGQLDAALVALPVKEAGLVTLPVLTEPFLLLRQRTKESAPAPTVKQVQDLSLLLLEEGHCLREHALAACRWPASSGQQALDASSLETLMQLVEAGLGVTFIPQMAAAHAARLKGVEAVTLRDATPERTLGLVWRRGSPLTATFKQLASLLGNAVTKPVAKGRMSA